MIVCGNVLGATRCLRPKNHLGMHMTSALGGVFSWANANHAVGAQQCPACEHDLGDDQDVCPLCDYPERNDLAAD